MRHYILLMRHGAVDRKDNKPEDERSLEDGGADVRQVANRLAEVLTIQQKDTIKLSELWHGHHRQVRQTAGILCHALNTFKKNVIVFDEDKHAKPCEDLDPEVFWRKGYDPNTLAQKILEHLKQKGDGYAVLLVGHAPHLGWVANAILGDTLPIARAELVCLVVNDDDNWWNRLLRRDRWLAWTIAPSDEPSTKDLREKIKSKMNLAGILGGIITAVLGVLFGLLLDGIKWTDLEDAQRLEAQIATGCFLVALGLYLVTVYAYDRLLMPSRFWGEKHVKKGKEPKWLVRRPPSSETWVLYQNMMRVWNYLFTPATFMVILGMLLFAYAVLTPNAIVTSIVVIFMLLILLYYFRVGPKLGTED
jgi:phosphohistidine phosphatase SixA